MLERARSKTQLFAKISPGIDSWISTGAGKSGISYNYIIRQRDSRVELSIATSNDDLNRQYFQQLQLQQEAIEKQFGDQLIWDIVEGRSACNVRYNIKTGGYRNDQAEWPVIQDEMIEAMIRLEQALRPYIAQL